MKLKLIRKYKCLNYTIGHLYINGVYITWSCMQIEWALGITRLYLKALFGLMINA